jgi:hypothetical protein
MRNRRRRRDRRDLPVQPRPVSWTSESIPANSGDAAGSLSECSVIRTRGSCQCHMALCQYTRSAYEHVFAPGSLSSSYHRAPASLLNGPPASASSDGPDKFLRLLFRISAGDEPAGRLSCSGSVRRSWCHVSLLGRLPRDLRDRSSLHWPGSLAAPSQADSADKHRHPRTPLVRSRTSQLATEAPSSHTTFLSQ